MSVYYKPKGKEVKNVQVLKGKWIKQTISKNCSSHIRKINSLSL